MRRHLPQFLTVLLLLLAFALMLAAAKGESPTMDEQNHIARGAAYLGTGDPRLSVEHPPLVNLLSALPVHVLLHPHLPLDTVWWETGEWYHFADLFLWEFNTDAGQITFLARLPIMGLGLLLIALVQRWARDRFGPWGGVLAATFCALDPNILAHAHLSTTDLGGAFFSFLAAYALWRALRRPRQPLSALGFGLALGLAFAAKISALLFGPLLALVALLDSLPGGPGRLRRLLGRVAFLAGGGVVALLVVWATYRFQVGPLTEGGPVVPAPPYLRGVLAVLDFASGGRSGYLLGQVSTAGWWYYFPVAFAVKTPLATLIGLLAATVIALRRPTRQDLVLLLPPVLFFAISTVARLNLGYRHLLPILPFVFVHLGRLVPSARCARPALVRASPALLALVLLLATARVFPHFLAYFNPIGGGPEGGWRVLADSNIDWGQDMPGLRDWMEREDVERVRLAWFGSARPEYYGISYDLLPGVPYGFPLWPDPPFDPENPEPGVYAISVSNLVGAVLPDPNLYAWFRARQPDAVIGYSIFIYRVE